MNVAEREFKPLLSKDGDNDTAMVVPDVEQLLQPSASTSSDVPTFIDTDAHSQYGPRLSATTLASLWTKLRARSWHPAFSGSRFIPTWAPNSGPIYLPTTSFADKLKAKRRWISLGLLFIVLIFLGIANLVVTIVKWKHTSRSYYPSPCRHARPRTPLDDYHIMKDNMELFAPQPGPNTTAIVTALGSEAAEILPLLILGHSISQHYSINSCSPTPDPVRLMMYFPGTVSAYSLCLARSVGWTPHAITSRALKSQHHWDFRMVPYRDQHAPLALWSLAHEGVERAVYLSPGSLVRGRFDELFTLPFGFAATSDATNENTFSANVLAVRPSTDIFSTLVTRGDTDQSRSWKRQTLQERLNAFFAAEAVRLPYTYNAQLAIKNRNVDMWDMITSPEERVLKVAHFGQLGHLNVRADGTEIMRLARRVMHSSIQQFKMPGARRLRREIGWWEDVWTEMEEERHKDFQRCEIEDMNINLPPSF
ncbi:hypothetical protein DENSPDRAFT_885219 [Dentipellis sp. KUC8613]|nr:hypothetical protein DENSPDRAFT_885219 [Dentipellis sp. KUC8613]